jgi:hypothetical protein
METLHLVSWLLALLVSGSLVCGSVGLSVSWSPHGGVLARPPYQALGRCSSGTSGAVTSRRGVEVPVLGPCRHVNH